MTDELLLPERARLLHIGPPKTGTTALQTAASSQRPLLLEHGVRYPGYGVNHRSAVAAFLGRRRGWHAPDAPPPPPRLKPWYNLTNEIEAERERRLWFGHEYAAGATDEQAARMAQALGPRLHVVVTLRGFASMLPSIWQEYLKEGRYGDFDEWLGDVLAVPRRPEYFERFHIRHDHGALVQRWVAAAGADRVTVVVLDRDDPDLLFSSFERMLGLPAGLLDRHAGDGLSVNRGMSLPEIELVRRLNIALAGERDLDWLKYEDFVALGAIARLLLREVGDREPRFLLPDWAARRAAEEAAGYQRAIRASGARVVGDLDRLTDPVATREQVGAPRHPEVESVPVDAAVEAIAGAVMRAVQRRRELELDDRPVKEVGTGDLARVLRRRVYERLERSLRKVRKR
ncbi:MAG: hypothetical protein QM635_07645 [Microbacteriaceae bacterium]